MKTTSSIHFAGLGIKTIVLKKKEPILGTVIVTDKCNLKCRHCSVNNITAVVHPYRQIRNEMQQLYDMGVRILFFCGGETFLWRDGERTLRDLVVDAKEKGFLIVNVVTSGTFPINLPKADLILLSIDGDKERHNAIHNVMWNIDTLRNDIIDYRLCNQKRSLYIEKHGRKNAWVCVWLPAHLEYEQGALSGLPENSPEAFLRPTMSAIV